MKPMLIRRAVSLLVIFATLLVHVGCRGGQDGSIELSRPNGGSTNLRFEHFAGPIMALIGKISRQDIQNGSTVGMKGALKDGTISRLSQAAENSKHLKIFLAAIGLKPIQIANFEKSAKYKTALAKFNEAKQLLATLNQSPKVLQSVNAESINTAIAQVDSAGAAQALTDAGAGGGTSLALTPQVEESELQLLPHESVAMSAETRNILQEVFLYAQLSLVLWGLSAIIASFTCYHSAGTLPDEICRNVTL
jgi:hypothetical protein